MILNIDSVSLAQLFWLGQERPNIRGKFFVITGKMEHYYPRSKFADMIHDMGGFVQSKVDNRTDFLIYTNDRKITDTKRGEPTTKVADAKERGVQVLSEIEAEKLLSLHPDSKYATLTKSVSGIKTFA